MVFTSESLALVNEPESPSFISTAFKASNGKTYFVHSIVVYEQVSPAIVEQTYGLLIGTPILQRIKASRATSDEDNLIRYVPAALSIVTSCNYIDVFRRLLQELYSYLLELAQRNQLISSSEFLRQVTFLINDTVAPPNEVRLTVELGETQISVPVNYSDRLPHNESCVAILIDLIDIKNIINFWEKIILHKPAMIFSENNYLLYLILEAFKYLIFPLCWKTDYIPTMNREQLFTLISSRTPVLSGANSRLITVNEALELNNQLTILDIDSNTLHMAQSSVLCPQARARISKRIQLVKAYYYLSTERLNTFQMNLLEPKIEDEEFVKKTRELLQLTDQNQREDCFISQVRFTLFYGIKKHLSQVKSCIVQRLDSGDIAFDKQAFLSTIRCCEDSCGMKEFMGKFVDSLNFRDFMQYFFRLDESYTQKFDAMLQASPAPPAEPFELVVRQQLTPDEFFRRLMSYYSTTDMELPHNYYASRLLSASIEILATHSTYFSDGLNLFRKKSFSNFLQDTVQSSQSSLLYGSFGIVKMVSNLLLRLPTEVFRNLSSIEQITQQVREVPDQLELYICYLRKAKCEDYNELFKLLQTLSAAQPRSFPKLFAAKVMARLRLDLNRVQETDGPLAEVAKFMRVAAS